jgi:hypothetical protein
MYTSGCGEGVQRCRRRWTRLAPGRTPHRPGRPLRNGSMIGDPCLADSFSTSAASKPSRGGSSTWAAAEARDPAVIFLHDSISGSRHSSMTVESGRATHPARPKLAGLPRQTGCAEMGSHELHQDASVLGALGRRACACRPQLRAVCAGARLGRDGSRADHSGSFRQVSSTFIERPTKDCRQRVDPPGLPGNGFRPRHDLRRWPRVHESADVPGG